jgi:PST family polysaccharide transporter
MALEVDIVDVFAMRSLEKLRMTNLKSRQGQIGFVRRLLTHSVAKNAAALYGVQFAGYVIPLVTLPYLARVLHAEAFGLVLFAQSFALWASITLEYGFNLSATREVAQNRGDRNALAATAAEVLGAKLILFSGFVLIAGIAAITVVNFRQHPGYLLWAIIQALAFGLSPFWYFQGTERMVRAVLVQLFARIAATIAIFIVVRIPGDGWKALAWQAAAGCAIVFIQTLWMYSEIDFQRPGWKRSVRALRAGWHMFVFRGANNIYGTANAFILGLFVPSVQVGYFGGAERIAKAVLGLTLPFTQAFYPHMSRVVSQSGPKASRLARWTIPIVGLVGLILAVALALLAPLAISLILGRGYQASVRVLYVFALILPLNAVNEALIMHWMLPRGMERAVGVITSGAILINIISASFLAPVYAQIGMAWAILIAEAIQSIALGAVLFRRNPRGEKIFREAKPRSIELT